MGDFNAHNTQWAPEHIRITPMGTLVYKWEASTHQILSPQRRHLHTFRSGWGRSTLDLIFVQQSDPYDWTPHPLSHTFKRPAWVTLAPDLDALQPYALDPPQVQSQSHNQPSRRCKSSLVENTHKNFLHSLQEVVGQHGQHYAWARAEPPRARPGKSSSPKLYGKSWSRLLPRHSQHTASNRPTFHPRPILNREDNPQKN